MQYNVLFHIDDDNSQAFEKALTQAADFRRNGLTMKRSLSPLDIAVNAGMINLTDEGSSRIVLVANGGTVRLLAKSNEKNLDLAEDARLNGLEFHADRRSMEELGLTGKDMLPFVKVVNSAARDIAALQAKGFSYIKP